MKLKKLVRLIPLVLVVPMAAQSTTPAAPDPWKPLAFLEGTWDAKKPAATGVQSAGTYTFRMELGGHVLH